MPATQSNPDALSELLRPWKLLTLAIGVAALVVGAMLSRLPDWNIPISLLMAAATYLTASWVIRTFVERRWRLMPVAALTAWGVVFGCYVGYWHFTNPAVLNSVPMLTLLDVAGLYVMAGLLWLYQGSVSEFAVQLSNAVRRT